MSSCVVHVQIIPLAKRASLLPIRSLRRTVIALGLRTTGHSYKDNPSGNRVLYGINRPRCTDTAYLRLENTLTYLFTYLRRRFPDLIPSPNSESGVFASGKVRVRHILSCLICLVVAISRDRRGTRRPVYCRLSLTV